MKTLPVAALLCTLALCASAQDILPAPASIHAEGVPPIEKATADRIGQYTQFRGKPLAAWHPARREMLVAFRAGNTTQIHLLRTPMGGLEQLTDYPDPARAASFEPRRGDYIVFLRDAGGDEATQVYRMDLPSRQVVRLTNPEEKHGIAGWNNAEDALLLISTQLDRTAQGGRRDNVSSDLYAFDPAHPQDRRKIATLPGAGWFGFDWSPDDRTLVAVDYKSIEDSEVWTIDVATGERRKVLPLPGEKAASFEDVEWSHDGKGGIRPPRRLVQHGCVRTQRGRIVANLPVGV